MTVIDLGRTLCGNYEGERYMGFETGDGALYVARRSDGASLFLLPMEAEPIIDRIGDAIMIEAADEDDAKARVDAIVADLPGPWEAPHECKRAVAGYGLPDFLQIDRSAVESSEGRPSRRPFVWKGIIPHGI
jgi:hypothetical protein